MLVLLSQLHLARKILCIGPQFRGSNAAGLFNALSRLAHIVSVVDEFYYIPLLTNIKGIKILNRILRRVYVENFNNAVKLEFAKFQPDIVLFYKGAFALPSTLEIIRSKAILINFYPDVSFHTHGRYLKMTLPLYDHIFTTKTFGIQDIEDQLGVTNVTFIPHGFDPEIHRKLPNHIEMSSPFQCDVSFIGTWSTKKENILSALKEKQPHLKLKIWGNQWEKNISNNLLDSIQGYAVEGDLYVYAIQSSKINLGILSEKVVGASSGDKITSRTFHIPASGGFMLHERNEDSITYFEEDKEAVFFENTNELSQKIIYYLNHLDGLVKIAENGYLRAQKDHSIDKRAMEIIELIENTYTI